MNLSKLSNILKKEPKFRFQQAFKSLYQDVISDWSQASVLPLSLRETLNKECPLGINYELIEDLDRGRVKKALIIFEDNVKVETVLIRNKDKRYTICLSSQAGCPLACVFCSTGKSGFIRNLTAAEILEQAFFWLRHIKSKNINEKIDNLVFMGMGEPFLNYDNFIRAVYDLNSAEKFNIGARRISVSSAGIIEGIKKLAGEKIQINLAISLNSALDSVREQLMPVAKNYSVTNLLRAVDAYISKTGRRVMFEYIMIKNINDGDDDAFELIKIMKNKLYLINLISYNPNGNFQASSPARINRFKDILEKAGLSVTVRNSQGQNIWAACGQLSGNSSVNNKKTV